MFGVIVYSDAAEAALAVNDPLPAIADQSVSISGGNPNAYIFNTEVSIIGAYGIGTSLTRARLSAPSLRDLSLPYIRPLERAAQVPDWPQFSDYRDYPTRVIATDDLGVEVSNDLAMGTERNSVALWFTEGLSPAPQGRVVTFRGTATPNPAAGVWGAQVITLDQGIPGGLYSVIGMDCFGDADLILARLIFVGQRSPWRPGIIGGLNAGRSLRGTFRMGQWGEFGRFNSYQPPQLEVWGGGAVNLALDVYLDCIRLG